MHDVLIVDTELLLEKHIERITLASLNTGVSVFGPKTLRGIDTFQRVSEYSLAGAFREVVEVSVDYGVPEIGEVTIAVEKRRGNDVLEEVWRR